MKTAQHTPTKWSEDRLQQEIYRWFNNTYPSLRGLLFHCPNGGSRDKREAMKLKYMGVYPGVADLICLVGGCSFIELKRPDGKGGQSESQEDWEITVKRAGYEYVVLNDLEEVKEYIREKIAIFGTF